MLTGVAAAQTEATPAPSPAPSSFPAGVERPLWEAGLGAAALNMADYRGSAHRRTLWLPLPYVVYRGKWLRADREGTRAVLLDTQLAEIDVSVGGSAPAASRNNPTRAGMDDLPATVEIGPSLNLTLWRDLNSAGVTLGKVELRLPLRAVMTVQRSARNIGTVFEPVLNLDLAAPRGWNVGLQGGLLWGSHRYHQHFYGVAADEATAARPAYEAGAGRAGWKALAAVSHRVGPVWMGAFLRHDDLGSAVFADSPLVERRRSWSAGLGLSWVFAQSSQMVRVTELP
ncbi:MAG: MipA/OmpV family protein [Burkholderiales bacterium]|nr:MipA/OmpV family protein [Burkholderiales bacterium]